MLGCAGPIHESQVGILWIRNTFLHKEVHGCQYDWLGPADAFMYVVAVDLPRLHAVHLLSQLVVSVSWNIRESKECLQKPRIRIT